MYCELSTVGLKFRTFAHALHSTKHATVNTTTTCKFAQSSVNGHCPYNCVSCLKHTGTPAAHGLNGCLWTFYA